MLKMTNLTRQQELTRLSLQEADPEDERHALPGDDVSLPSPLTTTSFSSGSSIAVTTQTWEGVPEIGRYFAVWGGQIVYTDRYVAPIFVSYTLNVSPK